MEAHKVNANLAIPATALGPDVHGRIIGGQTHLNSGATMLVEARAGTVFAPKAPLGGVGRQAYGASFIYTVLPTIAIEATDYAIAGVAQVIYLVDASQVAYDAPLVEYLPRSRQPLRLATAKPLLRLAPRRPNVAPLLSDVDEE